MGIGLIAFAAAAVAQPTPATCPPGLVLRWQLVKTGNGSKLVRRCVRPGSGTTVGGGLVVPNGGSCGIVGACASRRIEELLRSYEQTPADFGLEPPREGRQRPSAGSSPR